MKRFMSPLLGSALLVLGGCPSTQTTTPPTGIKETASHAEKKQTQTPRPKPEVDAGGNVIHAKCADTPECQQQGLCDYDAYSKKCFANAKTCDATLACAAAGKCVHIDYETSIGGVGKSCQPKGDADCQQSQACRDEGKCRARAGDHEIACIVMFDKDCKASKACKEQGKCVAFEGACVASEVATKACKASAECVKDGINCTPIDNRCRNTRDFDCSTTPACKTKGLCSSDKSPERDGGTEYISCYHSDEWCQAQPACSQDGLCGVSISGTSGYYKGHCPAEGPRACTTDLKRSRCAKTQEGCAQSTHCKSKGNCSAETPSMYCRPTKKEHCEDAEICKKEGMCKLSPVSSFEVCSN